MVYYIIIVFLNNLRKYLKKIMFHFLAILLLFHIQYCPANQIEQVLSLHADIYVNNDRTLEVCETITVYSLGKAIKHGIYRILPTTYSVISIQQNNLPCPYYTVNIGRRSH